MARRRGGRKGGGEMKVGLVTYQVGEKLGLKDLIALCEETGTEAVELRTTHAHGVEPALSEEERGVVRALFARSRVMLWGLGSVCEYHASDEAEVRRNIEQTKEFIKLAHDVGAVGVKVRPNGFPDESLGISHEHTLDQIAAALRECGQFAEQYGIELWLEVHGRGTYHPPFIRRIMEKANHLLVKICWNCNETDKVNGSIAQYFDLCRPWIRSVHVHDLYDRGYPWRELIRLLREASFDGCCLAEMPGSHDPQRVMSYYTALWREMTR
jgi:sugar phosphate isomerase/epimerase